MLKWLKSKRKKNDINFDGVANDPVIIPRSEHGISRRNIDEPALKVLYRLHKAGYQACVVGGAVVAGAVAAGALGAFVDAEPESVDPLLDEEFSDELALSDADSVSWVGAAVDGAGGGGVAAPSGRQIVEPG